jgi:hypothetical protein
LTAAPAAEIVGSMPLVSAQVTEVPDARPEPPRRAALPVAPHAVEAVLRLQRSAGNHATAAALAAAGRPLLQRLVGTVDDPTFSRSDTIHWYEWSGTAFTQTTRTLAKGTALDEARKTTQDDEVAFVATEGGEKGFVRAKNLSIKQWGPLYDATKEWVDPHRLMVTAPDNTGDVSAYKELHEEWYLDQAVLMDAYRGIKERLAAAGKDDKKLRKQLEDTKRRLALAMLQSFAKSAELKQERADQPIDLQMSPFLQAGAYYRSSASTELVVRLREVVAKSAKVSPEQLEILSDPGFAEVLAREFPVYSARQDKPKGVVLKPVPTEIGSLTDFTTSVGALLDNLDQGLAPTHTFVLDVTGYYKSVNARPSKLQQKVAVPLETKLLETVDAYLKTRPATRRADVIAGILNRIQLVVIATVKGAPVLLMPKLLEASADETDAMDDAEIAKHVDTKARSGFRERTAHDDRTVTSAMIESGARLDPISAKETLLKFEDPEDVLEDTGLIQVGLGTGGQKAADSGKTGKPKKGTGPTLEEEMVAKHKASMTLATFLGASVFSTFRSLSLIKKLEDGGPPPPYLTFYPEATCRLLAGLATAKGPLGSVDESFSARGITPVLDAAYMRMLGGMARAISTAGDMVPFLNALEIIHDQLQLILGIVEPYEQDKAFAAGMVKALREPPRGKKRPTVPKDLTPEVHHKASSMHSLASIVSAMEAQKAGGLEKTRELNVLVLKDNYYESAGAAEHSKAHIFNILDGYKLGKDALAAKHFEGGKQPNAPFDIFICDFHHNISVERGEYKYEDVVHQVDQLFEAGLVAERFTVAIDCTVDFTRSIDVRRFLEHNKGRIDRGELNVVLYRSAQKFDMLGLDNYYGGYTITINDGRKYKEFDERISQADDQVKGLAHQGMAHLGQFGTESQDEYRRLLIQNTRLLYDKLIAKGLGDDDGAIRIGTTTDRNNVFFDIQFPETEALSEDEGLQTPGALFFVKFLAWSRKVAKTAMTTRPSFGFPTTNLTEIAGFKTRLNPGLEDETALDRYADFFKETKDLLTPARQVARDEIKRRETAGEPLGKLGETKAQALAREIAIGYSMAWTVGGAGVATAGGAVSSRGPAKLDKDAVKTAAAIAPPTGAAATVTPPEPNPAPAALVVANAQRANPYLWFRPNTAAGNNLQVSDQRPGPAWNYVEQFCAVLATHWLTHGHGSAGLSFNNLGASDRDTAVTTLVGWSASGGSAQQVEDARKAINGAVVATDVAGTAIKDGTYPRKTRIWFGNARHAEAAVRITDSKWRLYDPNAGTTSTLKAGEFAAYVKSRDAIVVGLPS